MTTTQPAISNPETVRRSQSPVSHGRGGAGNINSKPSQPVSANDLQTPTLKSSTYTTGRGGSGNMASNTNPENARKAQDIDAPAHHEKDKSGTYHWGRGGEGNMMTVGKNGPAKTERSGSFKEKLEKGKEKLGLGKGRRGSNAAVADD